MRSISHFARVYLHREPVDMRKGINGLSEIIQLEEMGDLMGPHLFVFSGRRRDLIKIVYFDSSGFAMWQKRLEKNRFKWPKKLTEEIIQLTPEQLGWLLEGFDISKMKPFESLNFEKVC